MNTVLLYIFGDRYQRLVNKWLAIYMFGSEVKSLITTYGNNSLSDRLGRTEEQLLALTTTIEWHMLALQNQIISLQKQVDDLKAKSATKPAKPLPIHRYLILDILKTLAEEGRLAELLDRTKNKTHKVKKYKDEIILKPYPDLINQSLS